MTAATKNQTSPKLLAFTAKVNIVVPKQALDNNKAVEIMLDFFLLGLMLELWIKSEEPSIVLYIFLYV